MPRRPHDERDDYDDQPRRRSTSPVLLAAVVLGGLVVLGLVCGGVLLVGFWAAPRPMGGPAAVRAGPAGEDAREGDISKQREVAAARKVYSRDEFKQLVMGKTPEEVRAALGDPDRTDDGRGRPVWTYRGRATGKADTAALVQFARGAVIEVRY